MNIIIYGPQGSGKTTQAKLLAKKLGSVAISAGEVSRQIASENTPEGKLVKSLIDNGNLSPDNILFEKLKIIFDSPEAVNGFVLDGFPRNAEQLDQITDYLHTNNKQIDKVIVILLDEKTGIERIMNRVKTEGRADDTEVAIKQRLKIFHEQTEPIINSFQKQGIVAKIAGNGTINEVHSLILQSLGIVA